MRLGRHVDDRALLGVRIDLLDLGVALVRGVLGVDAAAADPAGGVAAVRPRFCVRAAVGLDGMPVRQVGVEQQVEGAGGFAKKIRRLPDGHPELFTAGVWH